MHQGPPIYPPAAAGAEPPEPESTAGASPAPGAGQEAGQEAASEEVELKLEFPAAALSALRNHPRVRALTRGRAQTRLLRSIYFDTPGLALARGGIALRVRRVGARLIQTVKLRGEARAGLFTRPEIETPVSGEQPDLTRLPDLGLRGAIERLRKGEVLVPVVETEFRRARRRLWLGESEILFDLDIGDVRTARGHAPIAELELELVRGDPVVLYDLALELLEQVPLRPSQLGKVDRGFALLRDERPTPLKARRLEHSHNATVDHVIGAVFASGLEQMQANEPVARLGEDPEGVHQMRVGMRRLRSAFTLFREFLPDASAQPLKNELRWLGRELGVARDFDVFLAETLGPLVLQFPDDAALKRLRDDTRELRDASYAHLRESLQSTRYARLLLELGRWVAGRAWLHQPLSPASARLYAPAVEEGRRVLQRRHRKARRLGRHFSHLRAEELHALRIELKKLRYGAEFWLSLYPRRSGARFVKRLAGLQDGLGHLNDVAAARRLLGETLEWMGPEVRPEHHRAAGFVAGWTAHGAAARRVRLAKSWKAFAAADPFWSES